MDDNPEDVLMYMGPRVANSQLMHKRYARKKLPDGTFSYNFKIPLRMGDAQSKRKEKQREFIGMNPKLGSLIENFDSKKELIFNSDFESGNLDLVYKVKPFEYNCFMRVDTNTKGNQQWFYFSLQHSEFYHGKTVRINVVNFTKSESLYGVGMRVVTQKKSNGFKLGKEGDKIKYKTSKLVRRSKGANVKYYKQLSFDYTFTAKNDVIYFSYCYPYTFSTLQNMLKEV